MPSSVCQGEEVVAAQPKQHEDTILLVEDDQGLAELIAGTMRTIGCACHGVSTGGEALAWLATNRPDLILLDYSLPDMQGDAFIAAMAASDGAAPFLVITGHGDERIAVEMMKAGARDYLVKDVALLERLPTAVRRTLDDIETARRLKETEGALRESERRLSDIIAFLPDATVVIDVEGRVIAWNRAIEELTGVPAAEMVGQGDFAYAIPLYGVRRPILVDMVLHPTEYLQSAYQNVYWSGDILVADVSIPNLRGRRADLWGLARVLRDARGIVIGAIETIRDITANKVAEEEILRLNAFYTSILNGIVNGVWVTDDAGVITFINRGLAAILEVPPEQLLGMDLSDLPPETFQCFMPVFEEARLKMQPVAYESIPLVTPSGRKTYQSGWLIPQVKDGRYHGMICTTDDITARKLAEEEKDALQGQLLQSQKMESIGRLAGGVAHDFNNMLSPIIGYSDLILAELSQNHPLYKEIKNIHQAALRAKDLTWQLLAFSRKQALEMKEVNLNKVITDFQKMLRRTIRENIEIVMQLAPDLGNIRADISQMEQIIMNLAVNAQDAMPAGGTIRLTTVNCTLEGGDENLDLEAGDYVLLTFSDNGQGMDADTLGQIFEPFFTTKAPGSGTGLGLATVYGIVRQHGGAIGVESRPGEGTTFKVYLPTNPDVQPAADLTPPPTTGPRGSETILVVEDDAVVRGLAEQILKRSGYTVIMVETAPQAVDVVRAHDGDIHLLLTDVVMPAMNGRQLYEQLSAVRPGLKVVYMSGYTQDIIATQGIIEEGTFFIQKPFTIQAVTAKVREALDSR